ncbi:MAG: hypothetical protein EB127_12850 [Alphaproteobacteria bacterium]|nr:hypothetical protein [Alphaproteobacteria bacterium]
MSMNIDTPIPSGDWTLYWHSSEGNDWKSVHSFDNFGPMKTWGNFLNVMDSIGESTLSDGMFFLMRNPIPPLWENHQNVYGGAYSLRIVKHDAGKVFIDYAIAAMNKLVTADSKNIINGLSISPKKGFNIIKLWNNDSTVYKNPTDLLKLIPDMKAEDILYTPFTSKKM